MGAGGPKRAGRTGESKTANETPHCPIYVETACAQACRCGCIGSQGNDETGCCVCGDKVSMVISVDIEVRSSRLGNRYRNCANGKCSDSCCCARKLTRSTLCSAVGIKRSLGACSSGQLQVSTDEALRRHSYRNPIIRTRRRRAV
jgi:hypothetical protein